MNYTSLKTEISDWLSNTDILVKADFLIELAEAKHQRDVRIREMLTRSAITVDSRQISLPTGFLSMKTLRLLTSPVTVLDEINLHEMTRVRSETTGKPKKFTVTGEIEFDKAPDSSYSGEIIYYKSLTALSSSNATNELSDRAPDIYLYGALLSAEAFLMNDERIAVWASQYATAVSNINAMDRKQAGPLISRVVGSTP